MEKKIRVNGVKITYYEEGEGFPFLVIHGWGPEKAPEFFEFQEKLAGCGYRVILLNLPGFKEGNPPHLERGLEGCLKSVLNFTDFLNLKEFYLLGYPAGGVIAIRLAVSRPEKVKALILLSPELIRGWDPKIRAQHLLALIFCGCIWMAKKIEKYLPQKLTDIKKMINELYNKYFPFLKEERAMNKRLKYILGKKNALFYLPEIKCPTLVIWGGEDFNFYPCSPFMGLIPNRTIKIIPGVGHNSWGKTAEKAIELIIKFVKNLQKTP